MDIPNLCWKCSTNALRYISPRKPEDEVKASAIPGISEMCERASQLIEKQIPVPDGAYMPFMQGISTEGLELLVQIQDYVDAVIMRHLGQHDHGFQELHRWIRLLVACGEVIEKSMLKAAETAFVELGCALAKQNASIPGCGKPVPLCEPMNVIDLPINKRDCPICREMYVMAGHDGDEDEGRKEERPVRLPCKHVFGWRCIHEHFTKKVTCPLCSMQFDFRQYLVAYAPINPWWIDYIRDGPSNDEEFRLPPALTYSRVA